MKIIISCLVLFFSLPVFACKMSAVSFDAFKISEAVAYFEKTADLTDRISKVQIKDNGLVVLKYFKNDHQCHFQTMSISPAANCSPIIQVVETTAVCE